MQHQHGGDTDIWCTARAFQEVPIWRLPILGRKENSGERGLWAVLGCGCTWEARQASLRGLLSLLGEGLSCQWAWRRQQASGLCT